MKESPLHLMCLMLMDLFVAESAWLNETVMLCLHGGADKCAHLKKGIYSLKF
jgi:hypothetical protein